MISARKALECAKRLSVLKRFPQGEVGLEAATRLLMEICESDESADELTARVIRNCDEWPGPKSLYEGTFGISEPQYQRYEPEWMRRPREPLTLEVEAELRRELETRFEAKVKVGPAKGGPQ